MRAEISVFIPEPAAPCKECVENAQYRGEDFGLVWCEHTPKARAVEELTVITQT